MSLYAAIAQFLVGSKFVASGHIALFCSQLVFIIISNHNFLNFVPRF